MYCLNCSYICINKQQQLKDMQTTDTLSKININEMVSSFDITNQLEENGGQMFNQFIEMIEGSTYTAQFTANVFYADCDGNAEYEVLDAQVDVYYDEDNYVTVSKQEFQTLINS